MKAAIAEALQPASILEIGVRYGYSGAAFLHGAHTTYYTGLDADKISFGGAKGAFEWARKTLPSSQSELILTNTQCLDRFPGGGNMILFILMVSKMGTAHTMTWRKPSDRENTSLLTVTLGRITIFRPRMHSSRTLKMISNIA